MSANVVIYTTTYCPFCDRAKALLKAKQAPYEEIRVDERIDLRDWLATATRQRTVPQIFVNGRSLGGFQDIAALDKRGELEPLLRTGPGPSDPLVQR